MVLEKVLDKIFKPEDEEELEYLDAQQKIIHLKKQVKERETKHVRMQRDILSTVADNMSDEELSEKLREIAHEIHIPKETEEQAQMEGMREFIDQLIVAGNN